MPDHAHLLLTLGSRLPLSGAIARLKTKTANAIRAAGSRWQDNFYDHQLRPGDSIEATIRYIWLNPYAVRLISNGERWPAFFCATADWAWFEGLTDHSQPFPEWLR